MKEYQRKHPKLRQGSGDWEQVANRQTRRITRAYDEWSAKARRALNHMAKNGATLTEQQAFLEQALRAFERTMIAIYDRGIDIAKNAASGSRRDLPGVVRLADNKKHEGSRMISENLIPLISASLMPVLIAGLAFDSAQLQDAFLKTRSLPAPYAGGAWVMIFETQRTLGFEREAERMAAGLSIERVRWVLDARADHCTVSPGYHGCSDLAGEYDSWKALPTVPAGQVTCRGNCILPQNRIDVTQAQALIRGWYSGLAFKFITESGIEFAVTANHPVLTPKGWLKAQFLNESDYVIKSTFGKVPIMAIDDDHEDMPALIEEIWRTFFVHPGINTCPNAPIMADDFHGDGRAMNGDIDIILPCRTLWGNVSDPLFEEAIDDKFFHSRLLTKRMLSSQSTAVKILNTAGTASNSSMISRDLRYSLFNSHLSPLNLFGFALTTQGKSLSFESIGDSPSAYLQILRQLQDTFARQVTLDKIIKIINFDYSGHVYDAQTDTGYYLLTSSLAQRAGIVNSNCRCHLEVFRDGNWQRGVYE